MIKMIKKGYKRLVAGLCAMLLALAPVQAQAADQSGVAAIFNAEYYYNRYPDLQETIGMDRDKLLAHYMGSGIREGRFASEDFNLLAYMQNNLDLLSVFGDDYAAYCRHYAESGRAEGRSAVPETEDETLLGSYTTEYNVNEQRAVNVELAAARVNGIVLQPQEQFSFNTSVLPRTTANGYVPGPAFSAGREIEAVGGGICQVSSTLYVAMLLSGMPATERYYHSLPVDYVPAGLDATIAGNYKDLKFVNVFSFPVSIKAEAKDGVLTVSLHEA